MKRRIALDYIATQNSRPHLTWIFTDDHGSDKYGRPIEKEIRVAARRRGSPFISVILASEKGKEQMDQAGVQGMTDFCEEEVQNTEECLERMGHCQDGTPMVCDALPVAIEAVKEAARRIKDHIDRCQREG
jgi:hypothetical protein